MRFLRIADIKHLDGTTSQTMIVPVGTRRTKRRTFKKWIQRAAQWRERQMR